MSKSRAPKRASVSRTPNKAFELPPGLIENDMGDIAADIKRIPVSPLQLLVTGFRMLRDGNEVVFLFGNNSRFENENSPHFSQAVEVTMGSKNTWKNLVKAVFDEQSANSDFPMIQAVEGGLSDTERAAADKYSCDKLPPPDGVKKDTYRSWHADFAATYVADEHGGIEFLEFPGTSIATLKKNRSVRDGDRAKSLVLLVMIAQGNLHKDSYLQRVNMLSESFFQTNHSVDHVILQLWPFFFVSNSSIIEPFADSARTAVVKAFHDHLAKYARIVALADTEDLGPQTSSPWQEKLREETYYLRRLDRQKREGELVDRHVMHDCLTRMAVVFRKVGERLERRYGPEAFAIYIEAIYAMQREIQNFFDDDDNTTEAAKPQNKKTPARTRSPKTSSRR